MSLRWPRLLLPLLLVVGLQLCEPPPEVAEPSQNEDGLALESSPPAEVIPNAEDSMVQDEPEPEPVDTTCTDLLASATVIANGGSLELPTPYRVEQATEPDPSLVEQYGFHPLGTAGAITITVWPELHESDEAVAFTVLHELGHFYDDECLTYDDRQAWLEVRTLEGSWYSSDYYSAPVEDFADAFAVCYTGTAEWWTMDGPPPGAEDCVELSRLVEARR